MENLGKITLFFVAIALSLLVTSLETYIVLSVANLYEIEFIIKFSFAQIYILLIMISMIKFTFKKKTKEESEKDFITVIKETFESILTYTLIYLMIWGVSFLLYNILI